MPTIRRVSLRLPAGLLAAALCASPLGAEEPPTAPVAAAPRTSDAHVEEALAQSGANRGELERVLRHFAGSSDPRRLEAARFLVAHMPGKGYIVTALKDARGTVIPYDPLAYPDFETALQAYERLEKEHERIDFARDRLVSDLETLKADFLIAHVETAFVVWEATPEARRPVFDTFLEHVLPYRGSEEPAEAWLTALRTRLPKADGLPAVSASPSDLWSWIHRDVASRLRFNERYYLHPTDQGFSEMERSGQGRCEDITNMTTYAARALGLATAADYTPAWAHRDNNHAWNVLLDASGRGQDAGQAHAAKVYRKTYALQRGNLAYLLPPGREAPNRFLSSRSYADVTDQYTPTSDVVVPLDRALVGAERFAYLCVFNGGEWTAIHWARVEGSGDAPTATFSRMGRGPSGILYLPAVHDGTALKPVAPPLLLHPDGSVSRLRGEAPGVALLAADVAPPQTSPDTFVTTPTMHLVEGTEHLLQRWSASGWTVVKEFVAGKEPLAVEGLPSDALYWLVPKSSRRLERPFTVREGRQRFW